MKPYKGKDVEGFLESLEPEKREIVLKLRREITKAIPDSKEVIKWGTLVVEREKIIGAIMVHKDHVNLQLWRGAELNNQDRLLQGDSKGMRHIAFASKADIKRAPLRKILVQAGRL